MTQAADTHRWVMSFDVQIRPVRRVLASLDPLGQEASPHTKANLIRLLSLVQREDLPESVKRSVDEMVVLLEEADDETRHIAYGTVWQMLGQLDRTLGLPLPRPSRPRRRGPPSLVRQALEPRPETSPRVKKEKAESVSAPPPVWPGNSFDAGVDTIGLQDEAVERLLELGIDTVGALLMRGPQTTEVIAPVRGAGRQVPEGQTAIGGRVTARVTRLDPAGGAVSEVHLQGADRACVVLREVLDKSALKRLAVGAKVVLAAEATSDGDAVQLEDGRPVSVEQGRAHELRFAEADSDHGVVLEAVGRLMPQLASLSEPLPHAVLERLGLASLSSTLMQLYTTGDAEPSVRQRLAFEEYLAAQLGQLAPRFLGAPERGIVHPCSHRHLGELVCRGLAPELSDAAQAVFEDIKRDLMDARPMQRLVFGDGGSEIDAVALRAAIMVAEARSQVLVVSPDAMSAAVRYEQWRGVLEGLGYASCLLGGAPRRAEEEGIRRGETLIVFGGPAVLDLTLDWRRLGLVVADEQNMYGRLERALSRGRTPRPDMLVLSRANLPWSCLQRAYPQHMYSCLSRDGAASASVVGWEANQRSDAYDALAKHVDKDGSALVAFPLTLAGTDVLSLAEAHTLLQTLSDEVFGGASVTLYHGAMTREQRESALRDFEERRARVLVATTTIELTPPMPRPVVGLIEHADRVDVQRLMSLRDLVTESGMLHLVYGGEPRSLGVRFAGELVQGVSNRDVVRHFSEAFQLTEGLDAGVSFRWRWGRPDDDLSLVIAAREVAADALRATPSVRSKSWQGVLGHAAVNWQALTDASCPIPKPKPKPRSGSSRRRKRRRRRRS